MKNEISIDDWQPRIVSVIFIIFSFSTIFGVLDRLENDCFDSKFTGRFDTKLFRFKSHKGTTNL